MTTNVSEFKVFNTPGNALQIAMRYICLLHTEFKNTIELG